MEPKLIISTVIIPYPVPCGGTVGRPGAFYFGYKIVYPLNQVRIPSHDPTLQTRHEGWHKHIAACEQTDMGEGVRGIHVPCTVCSGCINCNLTSEVTSLILKTQDMQQLVQALRPFAMHRHSYLDVAKDSYPCGRLGGITVGDLRKADEAFDRLVELGFAAPFDKP